MKNRIQKKTGGKIIGLLMMACLLGMISMPVYATDILLDDETTQSGDTEVKGQVSEKQPGQPSYVVSIPATVDFGKIMQPTSDTDSFRELGFDVKLVEMTNVPQGSGVVVLVHDTKNHQSQIGGTIEPTTPFQIEKAEIGKETKTLDYSVCLTDGGGNITTDLRSAATWFPNGYLYGVFNSDALIESTMPGILRLNERQLFGETMSDYTGLYTGHITFYTAVVSSQDYKGN